MLEHGIDMKRFIIALFLVTASACFGATYQNKFTSNSTPENVRVAFTNANNMFVGTNFSGNGAGLTNIPSTNIVGLLTEASAVSFTNPANVFIGQLTGTSTNSTALGGIPPSAYVGTNHAAALSLTNDANDIHGTLNGTATNATALGGTPAASFLQSGQPGNGAGLTNGDYASSPYQFVNLDQLNANLENYVSHVSPVPQRMDFTNANNTFVGSNFIGSGAGLTNLQAAAGGAFYTNIAFISPDGTTDGSTTTNVQAALDRAFRVQFYNGATYYLTNAFISTNGNEIDMCGARLKFVGSCTNAMFFVPTNAVPFFSLRNGFIDGQDYRTWWTNPKSMATNPVVYPTYNSSAFSNRYGVVINARAVGVLENVSVVGWSGVGCLVYNSEYTSHTTPAAPQPRFKVGVNNFETNYLGLQFNGWTFDTGNSFVFPANWPAEYITLSKCSFYRNGIGVAIPANVSVKGSDFNANMISILIASASNIGHSEVVNNTINHNLPWAIWSRPNATGMLIADNVIAGGGDIFLDSIKGYVLRGNFFSGSAHTVVITNIGVAATAGPNFFFDNTWDLPVWGTSFLLVTNYQGGYNSTNFFGRNHSVTTLDTDGTAY